MEKLIHIPDIDIEMEGMLNIPQNATGIVLFAHGSGSSRLSPRNNFVAKILNDKNLGILLIDLLSKEEDMFYQTRFDIDLLTHRLRTIVEWLKQNSPTKNLAIGLFGASTGAAAALGTAAYMKKDIKAVVSRGGRPDLAMPIISQVAAPTLLIVGGDDFGVIEMNQLAYNELKSPKKMEIVSHATHLFEEPGKLEEVARLATNWFLKYL
jgi:putative phosphoribosyl transferase